MQFLRRTFPRPFLTVYPPLWIGSFLLLVTIDLVSKKMVTDHLDFGLTPVQEVMVGPGPRNASVDGAPAVSLLGDGGRLARFALVFNDRFVFGSGPSAPVLGIYLTGIAILFLFLYRWRTESSGHGGAWLLVFSGAVGNFIDKLFVKSLATREWTFSPSGPQSGHVSGVVDFIECIWFGWRWAGQFHLDLPVLGPVYPLGWLAWERWPTFNVADALIVVGIGLLIVSMYAEERRVQQALQVNPGS